MDKTSQWKQWCLQRQEESSGGRSTDLGGQRPALPPLHTLTLGKITFTSLSHRFLLCRKQNKGSVLPQWAGHVWTCFIALDSCKLGHSCLHGCHMGWYQTPCITKTLGFPQQVFQFCIQFCWSVRKPCISVLDLWPPGWTTPLIIIYRFRV